MKKIVLLLVFSVLSILAWGQTHKAYSVYLSEKSYLDKKADVEGDCNGKKKIKVKIAKTNNVVYGHDTMLMVAKDKFLVYENCHHQQFKIYNDRLFKVIASNGLTIYSLQVIKNDPSYGTGNITKVETHYFFSDGINGYPQPLSIFNLKKAFSQNLKFHKLIDTHFINDESLLKFDSFTKTYVLINNYNESLQ